MNATISEVQAMQKAYAKALQVIQDQISLAQEGMERSIRLAQGVTGTEKSFHNGCYFGYEQMNENLFAAKCGIEVQIEKCADTIAAELEHMELGAA